MFWCASRLSVSLTCSFVYVTHISFTEALSSSGPAREAALWTSVLACKSSGSCCLPPFSVSLSLFFSVSWEGWKVRSAVLERVKVCITPHSCVFSPPLSQSLTGFLLFPLTEHKEGPEWRKAVPSYTQSSSSMDFRNWNTLPRDESQESLPKNWEMAYTETGMVYFIE